MKQGCWLVVVIVALCAAGCGGGGGHEIVVSVTAEGDTLAVTNRSGVDLAGAHVVVQSRQEGEGGTGRICADESVGTWAQGEPRTVPRCGEKTLIRISSEDGNADFVYVNDRVFRKIGRKEIPLD